MIIKLTRENLRRLIVSEARFLREAGDESATNSVSGLAKIAFDAADKLYHALVELHAAMDAGGVRWGGDKSTVEDMYGDVMEMQERLELIESDRPPTKRRRGPSTGGRRSRY